MHATASNYHHMGTLVVGWQNWRNAIDNGANNSVEWIFEKLWMNMRDKYDKAIEFTNHKDAATD